MRLLLFVFVALFVALDGKAAEAKNKDITIVVEMTEILDNCAYVLLTQEHVAPKMSFEKTPHHAIFKDACQEMKFLKEFISLLQKQDQADKSQTRIALINHSGSCIDASLISTLADHSTPTENLTFCGNQDIRSMFQCPGLVSFQKNKGDREDTENYVILIVADLTKYTDNIWDEDNSIKYEESNSMEFIFHGYDEKFGRVNYFTVLSALDLAHLDEDAKQLQLTRLRNLACFDEVISQTCQNFLGSTYDAVEDINMKFNNARNLNY